MSASRLARARDVAAAFLRIGWLNATGYPLSFVMTQLNSQVMVFVVLFIDKVAAPTSPSVGADYFSFAVLGLVGAGLIAAGLQGLSGELEYAIQQGRFEYLLVQPVRWRSIPIAMMQVPVLARVVTVLIVFGLSIPLGARFTLDGALQATAIAVLAVLAGAAVAILAGSVKVLAKRGDPVVALYMLATMVLSGVYFPVEALPAPLRATAWLLPNTYVISALRDALLPGAVTGAGPAGGVAIAGLALITAISLPVALFVFGRALRFGKRMGLLGSY